MGTRGIFGPTLGYFIFVVSKRDTIELPAMIAATWGVHIGVTGTLAAVDSK